MTKQEALALVYSALGTIDALAVSEGLDDDDLVEGLEQSGISPRDAAALVSLLPLACGRAVLERQGVTGLPNHAWVGHPKGKTKIYLTDQPIYKAAVQVAMSAVQDGTRTPRAFELLVNHSVELRMLSAAMRDGQRMDRPNTAIAFYVQEEEVFVKPPWWRRDLF